MPVCENAAKGVVHPGDISESCHGVDMQLDFVVLVQLELVAEPSDVENVLRQAAPLGGCDLEQSAKERVYAVRSSGAEDRY